MSNPKGSVLMSGWAQGFRDAFASDTPGARRRRRRRVQPEGYVEGLEAGRAERLETGEWMERLHDAPPATHKPTEASKIRINGRRDPTESVDRIGAS